MPLSHGRVEVESGGTSLVRTDQHQLGRRTLAVAGDPAGVPARHDQHNGAQGDRRVVGADLQAGVKVSAAEMRALHIQHHEVCPNWNYTFTPRGWEHWN